MAAYIEQNDFRFGEDHRQREAVLVHEADRLKSLELAPKIVITEMQSEGVFLQVVDDLGKALPGELEVTIRNLPWEVGGAKIYVITTSIQTGSVPERHPTMIRKIFRTGNSIVVSLPKEWLEALRLSEGAAVNLELDRAGGVITLAPLPDAPGGVDEEFARQVSDFIDQYRPALEALAGM